MSNPQAAAWTEHLIIQGYSREQATAAARHYRTTARAGSATWLGLDDCAARMYPSVRPGNRARLEPVLVDERGERLGRVVETTFLGSYGDGTSEYTVIVNYTE